MAHFTMAAGTVSRAIVHPDAEELWFVLEGSGELWLAPGSEPEKVTTLEPGVSVAIPSGCAFQFRVDQAKPLEFLAVTMPPWPGDHAARRVAGRWAAPAKDEPSEGEASA